MSDQKTLYHVSAIRAENFCCLESCDVTLDGKANLIPVRGKNGQGKTTLLNILKTLEGGRNVPGDPVRHGSEEGMIGVDLVPVDGNGDRVEVRRTFKGGKSTMKVKAGGMAGNQGFLDGLVGPLRDPLAFLNQPEKKQVEQVLGMVDLGGFDLEANTADLEKALNERREVGRDVKRLKGATESLTEAVRGFNPETAVDSVKVAQEYREASDQESAIRRLEDAADAAERRATETSSRVNSLEQRIADLQEQLKREALDEIAQKTDAKTARENAEQARAGAPDIEAIKAKMDKAAENDELRGKWSELQNRNAELTEAEKDHSGKDAAVSRLRMERENALSKANWPAQGMGFDPEASTLTLHGARWDQASDGEKFTAAVEVAVAQPSSLRVLWIKNGSLLDQERLVELERLMAEHQYKAFIEIVADHAEADGLFVDSGKVSQGGK